MADKPESTDPRSVELLIPSRTILKLLFAALIVVAIVQLWPLVQLIVVALLLAIMLSPIVEFFEVRFQRRGLGVIVAAVLLGGAILVAALVIAPEVSRDVNALVKNLPATRAKLEQAVPSSSPIVKAAIDRIFESPATPSTSATASPLAVGRFAIAGITAFIFALVLTIYFLYEGQQLLAWIVGYIPRRHRSKVRETLPEIRRVGLAYMRGQLITCVICGLWVWTFLSLLHVPGAVPLAALAFVADIIPVIGTIAMTVPGVLLAFTVSPTAAGLALLGYLAYHLVESYFIIPRVYGRQMRLSTLTVLLAVAVGGSLQGVLGAILILPFVAVYPVVERVWLSQYVGEDAVSDHRKLANAEDTDEAARKIIGR